MLEGTLKLTLNMDKTKITHVNDGFVFLGHRIIRKRIVMYFPPNTVIQDGEPLPYPVLYEQGQQLMFREPGHE